MKRLKKCIIALCLCAIAVAGWKIAGILLDYRQGENTYSALEEYAAPATTEPTAASQPEEPQPEETEPAIAFPQVDFRQLRSINPDIVGWIYSEDTVINYPVAQNPDKDYYLTHLFTGEENPSGCIYLDTTNDPTFADRNSIIYGHHMNNGSMFASLTEYKKQEYYDAHPRLLLVTPDANYVVEVFSGYVLSGWGDAWKVSFSDEADFGLWLERSKASSCFLSDVIPTTEDKILTLSTCTYEFDDARFVLLGILKKA